MIGGGVVGTRKALALNAAGVAVRVISREVTRELAAAGSAGGKLSIELRDYAGPSDIADAEVVVAATGTDVDLRIADDARALHRLIVVAASPDHGNFTSMAIHRAGPLAIGVSAGSVPGAAAKIRNAISERFDNRYAEALSLCAEMRSATIALHGSSEWKRISDILVGDEFCERVESGSFAEAVNECR